MNLKVFPIMFFAVVMGLGGFALMVDKISEIFSINAIYFEIIKWICLIIFSAFLILYILKILLHTQEFKSELNHPIKINFFATISISFLLLSMLFSSGSFGDMLFILGIVLQTFIAFFVIRFWIVQSVKIEHSNPAWFIPVVGNLLVVLAANRFSEPSGELPFFAFYYFSVSMFFYVVLFVIIFYRILFHEQLAQKFIPTLFITLAPPAVGFLAYLKLFSFDYGAKFLFGLMIFFVVLLAFLYKSFFRLKFFISWWAFSFPIAAVGLAFLKMFELIHQELFLYLGLISFAMLVFVIILVSFLTIKNTLNGEIFKD